MRTKCAHRSEVARVDEDVAGGWIERCSGPTAAAFGAWEDKAWDHEVGRVGAHLDGFVVLRLAAGDGLGRDFADLVAGHADAGDRHWLERIGLGCGAWFAGGVALRDRPFLIAEDGFAGEAIEDEHVALLGGLSDGWNLFAILVDLDERRWRVGIPVVDVVVRHLVILFQFASCGLERDDAGGVEVCAGAAAAVVLVGGIAECDVDEAVGDVEGHWDPAAGAAAILPAVLAPGAEVGLAGLGNGVEAPDFLTGDEVEGARVASEAVPALLAVGWREDG